jgi:hypothetical protein
VRPYFVKLLASFNPDDSNEEATKARVSAGLEPLLGNNGTAV